MHTAKQFPASLEKKNRDFVYRRGSGQPAMAGFFMQWYFTNEETTGGFDNLMPNTPYILDCLSWDTVHVKFRVIDTHGANLGQLTFLTEDVPHFVANVWRGNVRWNGHLPDELSGKFTPPHWPESSNPPTLTGQGEHQ